MTIVDATTIRYQPGAYDHALAALDPAARQAAEGPGSRYPCRRSQGSRRAAGRGRSATSGTDESNKDTKTSWGLTIRTDVR